MCDKEIRDSNLLSYFSTRGRSEGGPVLDVETCTPKEGYIVTFVEVEGEFTVGFSVQITFEQNVRVLE